MSEETVEAGSGGLDGAEEAIEKAMRKLAGQVKEKAEKQVEEYVYILTKGNQSDPFNTPAILERFFYRYGEFICRTETSIRAFHPTKKVWIEQKSSQSQAIVYYLDEMLFELGITDLFIDTFGRDNDGNLDLTRLGRAREKFRSGRATDVYIKLIINSPLMQEKQDKEFDADPDLFFCGNGVLNLVTGEVREVRSSDFLLKKSLINYSAEADIAEWETFVAEVFADNSCPEQNRDFIQEVFGYSLSGDMSAQLVFCHFGIAANGKSTLLKVLGKIAGEYAIKFTPDAISSKAEVKFERIAAQLQGVRCCIIDDIETKFAFSESFIKNLTDTEIQGRKLFSEHCAIKNMAKFHMGLNELPESDTQSEGYFRRIKITHYNRTFEVNAGVSRGIEDLIQRNLSAILKWAVIGYQRYRDSGAFTYSEDSQIVEQEYKEESGGLTIDILKENYEYTGHEDDYVPCAEVKELLKKNIPMLRKLSNTSLGLWVKKAFPIKKSVPKYIGPNDKPRVYPGLKLRGNVEKSITVL